MNMNKVTKTAAAVAAMVSVLAMPVSAAEWNTNGGTANVEGSGYVVEPTIEVELPGDLTFGINPMKLDVSEDPSNPNKAQIVSGDYLITNYSNIPVAVSAVTTVTAGSDVQLMDTMAMVAAAWDTTNNELKAVTGKKAVWLVQLYPKTISNDGVMTVTPVDAGTSVAADVIGDTLTATAPTTTVYFVLDAFSEADAAKSMGGFKFDGAVDPNAAFTESDLKVTTVFTLNTITEAQKTNNYDAYTTNGGKALAAADVVDTVKKVKP